MMTYAVLHGLELEVLMIPLRQTAEHIIASSSDT